jgi:hypothetical protein
MLKHAILESIYIYFMYNLFKTKFSFHHPLEKIINKQPISNYFKHPIYSGQYENKICPFGKLVSKLLVIWIFLRIFLLKKYDYMQIGKINNTIFGLVLVGSLLLNINSFVYLIPVFIYEFNYFYEIIQGGP